MQKNKKNLLIAGVIVLVVLAITGLVLTQGQNSNLQGLLPSPFRSGTPSQDQNRGGQVPASPAEKQAAQKAADAEAAKKAALDAAAKQAAADKLAAEQAAAKNDKQPMGSPSQVQNLVVKMSAQPFGGQKNPKTDGLDSVAGFDILSNNQALVVIKSMTFNIKGDNSPNVTNYELWANETQLTTDKPDVNISNKTVTFNNIRFVDFDQFKQVLIAQTKSINVVVKATTANVLSGKNQGVSVLYWLEVKSIALDYVFNGLKTPYTAEFTPAVAGQVSIYTK
ncbi:MAG: hypothetical protein WC843_02835 [Candidatus Gracilibacteria bacterium]|jgi:hypothetical protein